MKTDLRFEALERFEKMHSPAIHCQPVISNVLKEYAEKTPDLLLDIWTKFGWCGFAKGFLWFVNPEEYLVIIEETLSSKFQGAFVFARTAFGDLFFLSGSKAYIFRVQVGKAHELADDFSFFVLGALCDKDYLKNGLSFPLFKKAHAKLGELEANECYAIVPTLALGGEFKIEYLQKSKLQPYLSLLLQLLD